MCPELPAYACVGTCGVEYGMAEFTSIAFFFVSADIPSLMKPKTPIFELTVEHKTILAGRLLEFRHASCSERRHIALAVAKGFCNPDDEPWMPARYLTVRAHRMIISALPWFTGLSRRFEIGFSTEERNRRSSTCFATVAMPPKMFST